MFHLSWPTEMALAMWGSQKHGKAFVCCTLPFHYPLVKMSTCAIPLLWDRSAAHLMTQIPASSTSYLWNTPTASLGKTRACKVRLAVLQLYMSHLWLPSGDTFWYFIVQEQTRLHVECPEWACLLETFCDVADALYMKLNDAICGCSVLRSPIHRIVDDPDL